MPTPKKPASWMSHPIVDASHAAQLEREAALQEFHHGQPRNVAEQKALENYRRQQHAMAAGHHLAGMRSAYASGNQEAAVMHHDMYVNHAKILGFDPSNGVPPEIKIHEKPIEHVYDFKNHGADQYIVDPNESKPEEAKPAEPVKKTEIDPKKAAEGMVALALLLKGDIVPFPKDRVSAGKDLGGVAPVQPIVHTPDCKQCIVEAHNALQSGSIDAAIGPLSAKVFREHNPEGATPQAYRLADSAKRIAAHQALVRLIHVRHGFRR